METTRELLYRIALSITQLELSYNTVGFVVFLFLFLSAFLLCKHNVTKNVIILMTSTIFYAWNGLETLGVIGVTAMIVYFATMAIEKIYGTYENATEGRSPKEKVLIFSEYKKRAKKYLLVAFVLIIGYWISVKVGKFIYLENVENGVETVHVGSIIVPLGISYYTLSAVGYMLDVYWRKTEPEHNFFYFFSAMIYFPHIVQGPISKYQKLINQMKELPKLNYERICHGLQLMLWGYIKKMVIADRLVLYTATVFAEPDKFAGVEIVLAIVLCVIQIYADFSGCMDIVGGISQVVGIELDRNFRQPFFAKNAQEFWARWHMTLGQWTKEYIYLPIAMDARFIKYTKGMKKSGKVWIASFIKAFCPLLAVWLFTGLWHGTGIDYIIWGVYWCILMTLGKELKPLLDRLVVFLKIDTERRYFRTWQTIRTYIIFAIGRTFTVTGSIIGCGVLWKQLFAEHRVWTLFDGSLYTHGLDQKDFYVALLGIMVIFVVDYMHEQDISVRAMIARQPIILRWLVYYSAIFGLLIFGMYGPGFNAVSFAYGAF